MYKQFNSNLSTLILTFVLSFIVFIISPAYVSASELSVPENESSQLTIKKLYSSVVALPVFHVDKVNSELISYIPHKKKYIVARDLRIQENLWRVKLKGQLVYSPVADGEYVCYVLDNAAAGCLSRADGSTVWNKNISTLPASAPIIAGDQLIVSGANSRIYAFELGSGEYIWSYGYKSHQNVIERDGLAPFYFDNAVCNIFDKDMLVCLDLHSGSELWRAEVGSKYNKDTAFIPEVVIDNYREEIILTSQEGSVVSYSMKDGQVKWTLKLLKAIALDIREDRLAILSDKNIVYYDLLNKKELWHILDIEGHNTNIAIIDKAVIVFTTVDYLPLNIERFRKSVSNVSSYDIANGKEIISMNTKHLILSSIFTTENDLYFLGSKGKFLRLNFE
ncbi:MAG: PQQ-like beta-propeller repeat protein [Deltaproteobacteria bacterium]|nr:PQQ-like beta-propeller repeat protein [Deltaproteobacteria bacterium]